MSAPSQGRVKTCEGCVRSKIRCSRASSAQKCDRCIRLGLDCYYRLSKARDPKKRAARIEELEDKVDRILGQLTNNPQSGPSTSSSSQTSQISEPSTRNPCDVIGDGLVTQEDASRLLESYREMIPCFPYVQLPKDSTIESLRSEKPFLLLSILFVSSFQNVPLHLALEKISTAYLGGQVLQGNGVHPLDTLQGLLVTIGGYVHEKVCAIYIHNR
ncbi:uncharacterized protein N7483_001180 [Penicillium malachiteum]|uniref:uncharacterized protein n=1 Tax=Penicillium malachiteum TaxID=1324776 RepID=UPI0025467552|nr:uncharacterized protein N7483_001180 [Penicillium malachiteum]KAJ5736055.1 hypothetical protein N7483_001180 [Penicillium malachiteum]